MSLSPQELDQIEAYIRCTRKYTPELATAHEKIALLIAEVRRLRPNVYIKRDWSS